MRSLSLLPAALAFGLSTAAPMNDAVFDRSIISSNNLLTQAACTPLTADNPSTYWLEGIAHNGLSSFLDSSLGDYSTFRNVVQDFGADNSGKTDASTAIQNAINGKLCL